MTPSLLRPSASRLAVIPLWLLLTSLMQSAAASPLGSTGSTVYRCETVDETGHPALALRDSPCPTPSPLNQSRVIASKSNAPALDAARQQVARDERLADRMEQARLRQEAHDLQRNGRPAGIDGFKGLNSAAEPSPSASNAKPSKGSKHAKPKAAKVPKAAKAPKVPKVPQNA